MIPACSNCGFIFLDHGRPECCPRCRTKRAGSVMYVNWRGIPTALDQRDLSTKATPGTTIESSCRRPFGFTVVEKAVETRGECPSCGMVETLYAGICDRCRIVSECGS